MRPNSATEVRFDAVAKAIGTARIQMRVNMGRENDAFEEIIPVRVLVSPELDTFRFDDIWNLDLRLAKNLSLDRLHVQLVGDLFNVLNANPILNRQRNIANMTATSFGQITQVLSPRILRFGVRVGF